MDYSIDHNRLSRFGSIEFLAKQVVEGFITGLHKSPFHGFSVEFAEHRLYNPGESIKYIDWKLYGRTDKMFVKRFEEETNLRCQLVIDQSSSMYFPNLKNPSFSEPNKLIFSIYAAASLLELMRRQRDAVGLSLFDQTLVAHTRARSTMVHAKLIYSMLEKLMPPEGGMQKRQTAAAEAIHQIAERTHQRSLVVIFSDMMDHDVQADELFAALRHLRYNKHEVVLFHVLEKNQEEQLDFENRPHRFVDMESGMVVKLNPALVKEQYQRKTNQAKKDLMMRCGQYQIDYVDADINQGYHQVLLSYLLKRSKLL